MDTPIRRSASRNRADRVVIVPFGRQGTGWEVGYAALFLLAHEASYVNGHCYWWMGPWRGHIARRLIAAESSGAART